MTDNKIKQISTSAKTYAESLIQIAKDNIISYDAIVNDLNNIKEILSESSELSDTMNNPAISDKVKYEIIESIFANIISIPVKNFLKILIDKKRFNELEQIIQAFEEKFDDINNIKRVNVISAVPLAQEQQSKIIEKLQNKLQCNVQVNWIEDIGIIGGLVVQIGDDLIDNSLRNKLEKISKHII